MLPTENKLHTKKKKEDNFLRLAEITSDKSGRLRITSQDIKEIDDSNSNEKTLPEVFFEVFLRLLSVQFHLKKINKTISKILSTISVMTR